jgi:hypothetical protein
MINLNGLIDEPKVNVLVTKMGFIINLEKFIKTPVWFIQKPFKGNSKP